MIKELVQFTEAVLADETFRNLGMAPKEGLHIVLQVEKVEEQWRIADKAEYAVYSKKMKELTPLHLKCTHWWKASTMLGTVDTYKVFDVPAKAIHTVSPYCMGVKRTNLEGGEQYTENQSKGKSQVYDRINAYFNKAADLLDSDEDKLITAIFRVALNDKTRLHRWLEDSGMYKEVKDGEYVNFYLDLPVEKYAVASQKYLKEKLFNTGDYNVKDENDETILHGTSNWLNSFPTKKPFLLHQSATFDIAGRISSKEAQMLQEFSDMSFRKLFPNPLPLFVMKDELSPSKLYQTAIKLMKDDATSGGDQRKGYLEIIEELWKDFKQELGNYYLLFMVAGKIKDFDFVSRFDFNLNSDESPWKVENLFNSKGEGLSLFTVIDLNKILPYLFNNFFIYRWFDELEMKKFRSNNAYLMTMKYRKAFYDFIYKSKRGGVTGNSILEILMTGIKDSIRLDEYKNKQHSEDLNIRSKLNLLFNLHSYFSEKPNPSFMASNIVQLRYRIEAVARGEAHIETDEQFAFAAGQVIARIFWESETGDESYRYLEPFLAQSKAERFKESISNFFKRYKHGVYSDRFRNVSSEVMTYDLDGHFRDLHPLILAGVFSDNMLFKEKKDKQTQSAN